MAPDRTPYSSVKEARLTLEAVPYSVALQSWALWITGQDPRSQIQYVNEWDSWRFETVAHQQTLWLPSPELGRAAITAFLDFWVESPWDTSAVFIIPRILQRHWGFLSKWVLEVGCFQVGQIPAECGYSSLIPLCVLYVRPHTPILPPPDRVEWDAATGRFDAWHQQQADALRRMQ
jgi:hypothetical protein